MVLSLATFKIESDREELEKKLSGCRRGYPTIEMIPRDPKVGFTDPVFNIAASPT
jgi:hypothetical protein